MVGIKYYYVLNNEHYEKKKIFYSTFKNDLRVMMHPGNLLFILYVVEDLLIDKTKQAYNDQDENLDDENNYDDDESNDNFSANSSRSKIEEDEIEKSKSSEESKPNEKNLLQIKKMKSTSEQFQLFFKDLIISFYINFLFFK